ncbi:MAG: DEAD/DEAH box helicase [Deltaproteobacteria bacterium]|nr:DEAD/DEAH box helicase [Deltaproteobacteria bacterium]
MSQTLRPYQANALEELRAGIRQRKQRQLLVSPTGSGKTTIAAHMIQSAVSRGKRIWFLAHRKELIQQCSARLDEHDLDHGIIQAQHPRRRPWLPIQVASVATLVRRELTELPDLIIIDEAHRSLSASYQKIAKAAPKSQVIGLTATPWRLDGRPLGSFYESLVLVARPSELISEGWLLKPRLFAPAKLDLTDVHVRGGDYDEADLAQKVDRPSLLGDLVEHWRKLVQTGENRRTVVFAVNKEHSRHITTSFQVAGVRAAHLDEATSSGDRAQIIRDLAAGEIDIISNCQILTEGWDLPSLAAVVLARPTKSVALYLQMCGRGMRPYPGKTEFKLLDHASCVFDLGFPEDDRDYRLDGRVRARKSKNAAPFVRICEQCFRAFPSLIRECPECGWTVPVAVRKIKHDEGGELREYRQGELPARGESRPWIERLKLLTDLVEKQVTRGYKEKWSCIQYQRKLRHWPPAIMQEQAHAEVQRRMEARS